MNATVQEPKLLEVQELYKTYNTGNVRVEALRNINLSVEPGEFVAIMGPSGSGKTTFMNILGCLDRPTSGSYTLASRSVEGLSDDQLAEVRNKHIGFVFQNYNLLAQATALHNVELPLMYAQSANRRELAMDALSKLGMENRWHHRPKELSGGQQQRVAIARALVTSPSLLLGDEPTGNLDSKTGTEVMELLCSLNDQGLSIIIVTHEDSVAAYAKRLVRFLDGEIQSDEFTSNACGEVMKEARQ